MAGLTPYQTVGPYFEVATPPPGCWRLALGESVRIEGRVLDGAGGPVPDALVETWQADGLGRYHHPADDRPGPRDESFNGFGRIPTDADGRFVLETVIPGRVPDPQGGEQAPHVMIGVLARGLLGRLVTRLYFPDVAENAFDPVLVLVPESRRRTLIATRAGNSLFRFAIVLQGDDETVFFDV